MNTADIIYDRQLARELRRTEEGRRQLIFEGRMTADDAQRYRERTRGEKVTAFRDRLFVAWDGEGITDDAGGHQLVILANSEGAELIDERGIEARQAFDMMFDAAEAAPKHAHVIFAGGYDVNMILKKLLTRSQGRRLTENHSLTIAPYPKGDPRRVQIQYYPRHSFSLREYAYTPMRKKSKTIRKFVLWDVFGFFQSSFVKACQRLLPPNTVKMLDEVQAMKLKRGSFTADDIDDMLAYCRQELALLVQLMVTLTDHHERAGITLTRWDGAGASASAVLRAQRIADHVERTPEELADVMRYAYAGGRIEQYRYGYHDGPITTLDIRSAYPAAALNLPSMAGGSWSHIDKRVAAAFARCYDDGVFSVWHVRYRNENVNGLHPFFWRGPDGRISYPAITEGWYWRPEVSAALAHAPRGSVELVEGYTFHPADPGARPFAFIDRLFHNRAVLERQLKGRGWPLKLALNSLYGKMAQQVGGSAGRPPRYHQLEWAGWITSLTRSRLYDVAVRNLDRLVSIETDGASFTGTPGDLTITGHVGDQLGQWEVTSYDGGLWAQSGVYWLRTHGAWIAPKVRGIGLTVTRFGKVTAALSPTDFLAAWAHDDDSLEIYVQRFHGMATSSLTEQRWQTWCQWKTERRTVSTRPEGKRIHEPGCIGCRIGGLHDTLPTGGGISAMHTIRWQTANVENDLAAWLDELEREGECDHE